MELILWRHAQAQASAPDGTDMARDLTAKGQRQAQRVANWLQHRLPAQSQVLVSPAQRSQQTARALGQKFTLTEQLAPTAELAATWIWLQSTLGASPYEAVLLVGHQPLLGWLAARWLGHNQAACHIGKGALWWLRLEHESARVVLRAAISPALV